MNENLKKFNDFIEESLKELTFHKKVAEECNIEKTLIDNYEKTIVITESLIKISKKYNFSLNYINQFTQSIQNFTNSLPYKGQVNLNFLEHNKSHLKSTIENYLRNVYSQYESLNFNIEFFKKVSFFTNNIVAIGANGSGKTSLSDKFKADLQNNGVVISAQRILLIPVIESISNLEKTKVDLKQYQQVDKTNKNPSNFNYLRNEFEIVLKSLLSENISIGYDYRKKSKVENELGQPISTPPITKLDKTFEIWNSLIEHRKIDSNDGMNITLEFDNGNKYPIIQMSDGEKVMLFLIAQVLQAPKDGFIIIDEPEMYLHKTILKKLWDKLENERTDCVFIYLTHDLDFATSRTTSKKIWIKSYIFPNNWEIENIPDNDIPEILLFELLGSRKNILFCEGIKGSIDEKVYSVLFPELTIMPVGSCFEVINHTKAFNKLSNVNTKAFGLIDIDHHDQNRLDKLKQNNIFSFKVAEIENLFLDSDFLKILANQILVDESQVELIKIEIIKEFDKTKELQASNYVSAKVNYYFTDSDVCKGNELNQLENNYQEFLNKISINEWYNKRIDELKQMIINKDYENILISINNKGIKSIAGKHLNISDFTNRSLKLLQNNNESKLAFNKYFPEEIKIAGNKMIY